MKLLIFSSCPQTSFFTSMSTPLTQFLTEISEIEKRIDQYVAVSNMQLPGLPSIPSIPSMGTTFRSAATPAYSRSDPPEGRLSCLLLSVKQDIRDFLLTGDLMQLFKYAKSNQSELQFVENILRLISQRYSVWAAPMTRTEPPTQPVCQLESLLPPPSSSRRLRVYNSTQKQMRNIKR